MRPVLVAALALSLAACQSESDVSYSDLATAEAAYDMAEADAAAVVQPASQVEPPEPADRLLVRTGAVRIRAESHGESVARARALADALGGFVGDESSQRYADRVETTLTIRVPSARFDTLLAAVSALEGTVESRSVSVEDVTRRVADVEARLGARRAAEAQYLALLGRAGSIEDVLAVQVRLQQVREEIESAEAQLRAVRDQVALSTLAVTVFEASAAGITAGPGFFAQAARAVAAGWDGVVALTLALLTLWPLAVLVGVAAWLWRRRDQGTGIRRQRRRSKETGTGNQQTPPTPPPAA